jgi:hypothetical protein
LRAFRGSSRQQIQVKDHVAAKGLMELLAELEAFE